MQEQLNLAIPELKGYGVPSELEPQFWIRELRILSKWGPEKDSEIRRVVFRKGLNVIWSPPTNIGINADQRIAGHASGKTTLCRFIRYVLGEQKIGTETFRNALTHKFVNGLVAAEVRLNGETWSVARPFTSFTASKGFAQRGACLDDFLKNEHEQGTYEEFKLTLEQSARKIIPFDRLPDETVLTFWHYFPWFTRDQEAQFLKLYAWRENTASEADSPMLKQDQKAFVMRSIFDPAATDELDLIAQYEQLGKKIENAQKEEIKYEGVCEADREWMSRFPTIDGVDLNSELSVQAWQVQMAQEKGALQSEPIKVSTQKTLMEQDVYRALRDLEDAQDELKQLKVHRQAQHAKLNELEKSANATETPPPPPEDRVQAAVHLRPDRRFCRVPMWIARREGCKMAEEYAKELGDRQQDLKVVHEKAVETISGQRKLLSDLDMRLNEVAAEVRKLMEAHDVVAKKFEEFKQSQERKRHDAERSIDDAMTAVSRYRTDMDRLQKIRMNIEEYKTRRKTVGAQLNGLRRAREGSVGISDYFLRVTEFVLGEKVIGKVAVDRDAIKLECDYNDAHYTSAALNAAYNVMFDIAVMVMGIQGRSTHPRFLLHDGPRVADVSSSIYRRYFELAEDLEKRADGNPNFQYIITTTEPPPEEFCQEPYLRLTLDASSADGRLLKCDLI